MKISAKSKICLIIGDPVEHSLSPQMHNAAYEALGIDDTFVFVAAKVLEENTDQAVKAMRTMNIRGMTCTMPHKEHVISYLDHIDPVARKIGAVNTVVNEDGSLIGYNTDWLGVVTPLEKYGSLKGKTAAIIGAGGAARAALFGLRKQESQVMVFNRTQQRSRELVKEFGGIAYGMADIAKVADAEIIFSSIPVADTSIIPSRYITKNHIVFDALYFPYETQLLQDAKAKGATIIHGTEMLLHQGIEQFMLYTGKKAPEEVMHRVIMETIRP